MSYKKFEIIESPFSSPFFITETSIFPPKSLSINPFFIPENDLAFSLLDFPNSVFNSVSNSVFDSVSSDLVQIESTPFRSSLTRVIRRVDSPELTHLKALSDRVSSLESKFDRLLQIKERERKLFKQLNEVDRKYSWTAEIKGDGEKKYKWTAEIEKDDYNEGKRGERKYQWSTEIKGGGKDDNEKRVYTWKATIGGGEEKSNKKKESGKKEKKSVKGSSGTRIVEIEEPFDDHRTVVLRQAFAKRISNDKGKRKELSPIDAAALIQLSFRNYLLRRSQALRALRELAVAKTKLKEIRALFHNFSYRSRIAHDAEERQKFSERIIVLLLTVDGIEGVDLMVRAAKRSMVDELEAMLDVVDPQPGMRSLSMRRRTFDMPSGTIQKEIAEGVAQVVQMLGEDNETFEACV